MSRDEAVEAINLDAYLHSCECPKCRNRVFHSYDGEETKFCENCGQKLHIRAFTEEEIDDALFEEEMDTYEDL